MDNKIIKYVVLSSHDGDKLADLVTQKLTEGWRLQGGVSVSNGGTFIYAQAIVK